MFTFTSTTNNATRTNKYKSGFNFEQRRKEQRSGKTQLRKQKRNEHISKRRNVRMNTKKDLATNTIKKDPPAYTAKMEEYIKEVYSNDVKIVESGVQKIRILLSMERRPPIKQIYNSGVCERLIKLLSCEHENIVFESLWGLTNIAVGKIEYCNGLLKGGILDALKRLIVSDNPDLAEQAAWCLGNLAGDGAEQVEQILRSGITDGLFKSVLNPKYMNADNNSDIVGNLVWCISNIVRPLKELHIGFDFRKQIVDVCSELLVRCAGKKCVSDLLWTFSYISDCSEDENACLVYICNKPGLLPRIVQGLQSKSPKTITPALRTVGNIVTSTDALTEKALDQGLLDKLLPLLKHRQQTVRKESHWCVSNVCAGPVKQIDQVIRGNFLPSIVKNASDEESSMAVRGEALWCISNICSGGNNRQINDLVTQGVIGSLISMLDLSQKVSHISSALSSLECILRAGKESEARGVEYDYGAICENAGLCEAFSELQQHDNDRVYNAVTKILNEFFEVEEVVTDEEHTENEDGFQFEEDDDVDNEDLFGY